MIALEQKRQAVWETLMNEKKSDLAKMVTDEMSEADINEYYTELEDDISAIVGEENLLRG